MSKGGIVAIILISVGVVLLIAGLALGGFKLSAFDRNKYSEREETVSDTFSKIRIKADTIDVKLMPSTDGLCKLHWFEKDSQINTTRVEGDVLIIGSEERYVFNLFNLKNTTLTVYLPESVYGDVYIESDTGDISISEGFELGKCTLRSDTGDIILLSHSTGLNVELDTGNFTSKGARLGDVSIEGETGDVKIENATCGTLAIELDTGDATLRGVVATTVTLDTDTGDVELENSTVGPLSVSTDTGEVEVRATVALSTDIKTSTGDVELYSFDSETIKIKTSTGDVYGELLSPMTFDVRSNTGKERYPAGSQGGLCEVRTSTGDIELKLVGG